MPSSAYTYMSSNKICSRSWLDHNSSSDGTRVTNIKIMFGSTFYILVKLELLLSVDDINIATPNNDSGSDKKDFIVWNTVTDVDISEYTIHLII